MLAQPLLVTVRKGGVLVAVGNAGERREEGRRHGAKGVEIGWR